MNEKIVLSKLPSSHEKDHFLEINRLVIELPPYVRLLIRNNSIYHLTIDHMIIMMASSLHILNAQLFNQNHVNLISQCYIV